MMMLLRGISKVERRQQGEYIGLKKCNQEFNKEHEDHEQGRENTHTVTCYRTFLSKYDYQRRKCQNDDVARIDIGRQTNHQYGRLDEYTHYLNGNKDELDT